MTKTEAEGLAARLDFGLGDPSICEACLLFVSMPLAHGDEAEVRRAVAYFRHALWDEGLALPLQAALQRARRRAVPDADRALADIAERGSRAAIVGAAVLRLAAEQAREITGSRARPGKVLDFRPPETGRLTPEQDRNTM